jgi:acyl-homoserine lactone acylase PvdQ
MKKSVVLIAIVMLSTLCRAAQPARTAEMSRWAAEAKDVTIVRDDWGVAHVYGKTDADTVFGMIYAQCEDDFNRIETNYLNAMGRLAETEGEGKVYQDLRMKMFIDPEVLKSDYASSPEWLRKLMDAFADGVNFYLAQHPQVNPRVIQHFEPWMAASAATSSESS